MSKKHKNEWGYNQEQSIEAFDDFLKGKKSLDDVLSKNKKSAVKFNKELDDIICGQAEEEPQPLKKIKYEKPVIISDGEIINQKSEEKEETIEELMGIDTEDDEDSINAIPAAILTDYLNDGYRKIDYFDGHLHTYVDIDSEIVQDLFLIDKSLDTEVIGESLVTLFLSLVASSYPTAIYTEDDFDKMFCIEEGKYNKKQFVFFMHPDYNYIFAYEVDPSLVDCIFNISNEDYGLSLSILGSLNYVKRHTTVFDPSINERVEALYNSDDNEEAKYELYEDFKNDKDTVIGDVHPNVRDYDDTEAKYMTILTEIFGFDPDLISDDEEENEDINEEKTEDKNIDIKSDDDNEEEFDDLMDDINENTEKKPEHVATVMYKGE